MKILFIENRYTTYLWDSVAKKLIDQGHQIFWIIQNKQFTPKNGVLFFLEVTPKKKIKHPKVYDDDIKKVIKSDRGLRFYEVPSDDHLFYAREQISEIIKKVKPDVGFGECTLYQEVITMQQLRKNHIPYYFPTSCRFPINRFSFYLYDTLFPFGGSNETIPDDIALKTVEGIGKRKIKPVYLENMTGKTPTKFEKLKDKLKIIKGHWEGEIYNTPSISTKIGLKRRVAENIKEWDKNAVQLIKDKNAFKVLYPLQMQPESTIDIWATDFNNQTDIINKILNNTPNDVLLIVKPNPTSSLEINDDLKELVKLNPRIIPLHHRVKMEQIIDNIDLVITTTGTIGVECIFANKPVVNLVKSFFNYADNCVFLEGFQELPNIISRIKNSSFPSLSDSKKVEYLNYLNKKSYQGLITCTYLQKNALEENNINNITYAFVDILNSISITQQNKTVN